MIVTSYELTFKTMSLILVKHYQTIKVFCYQERWVDFLFIYFIVIFFKVQKNEENIELKFFESPGH